MAEDQIMPPKRGKCKRLLDVSTLFGEDDIIILKYITREEYECVELPPGYIMVVYDDYSRKSALKSTAGTYHVETAYWMFIIRHAGRWKIPIGRPCSDSEDGYSFILVVTTKRQLSPPSYDELSEILAGTTKGVTKISCSSLEADFGMVFKEILDERYDGDIRRLRDAFKRGDFQKNLEQELLRSRLISIRVLPYFVSLNIFNLNIVPKEKCGGG